MVARSGPAPAKILTLFGTRPEVIKLAPGRARLGSMPGAFLPINVSSSQHTDLLYPLIRAFDLRLDHDLRVMQPNQTLSSLCGPRACRALDPILLSEQPDVVLVQGDTTTALAGAHGGIPPRHSGRARRGRTSQRRSDQPVSRGNEPPADHPARDFPLRRHERTTAGHAAGGRVSACRRLPDREPRGRCPAGDARQGDAPRRPREELLARTQPFRRILLTTHRRESFGERMSENLNVLKEFVRSHPDTALIFPVHPNPSVSGPARAVLGDCPRIHLAAPMDYEQFVLVMSQAWLIVSDSGGVQEEAPSLGKPLLILRENTERPKR